MSDFETGNENFAQALASRFVMVRINRRAWTGKVKDDDAAKELREHYNMDDDAFNVVRKLLAGRDVELSEVLSAQNTAYTYYAHNTIAMSAHKGQKSAGRLRAQATLVDFLSAFSVLQGEYKKALSAFLAVYAQRREEAAQRHPTMADKLPDSAHIGNLFSLSIEVLPLPAATNFDRVLIPGALVEALTKRMIAQQEQAYKAGLKELLTGIVGEVERIAGQLTKLVEFDGEGRRPPVYDSLVGNLVNMLNLLDTSLAGENTELRALSTRLRVSLCSTPAKQLRENTALAEKVAVAAKSVLTDIGAMDLDKLLELE
jgi:hypothetical protein